MEEFGLEFTLTNGKKDCYDPVTEDDIEETETEIILTHTYEYRIKKSEIVSQRRYQLCSKCGWEKGTCCCDDLEEGGRR